MENVDKLAKTPPVKPFTVKDHNQMIETIDSVIVDIQSFKNGDSNLELDNAIKSLLEASTRINNHYTKVNNPTTKSDANAEPE